MSACGIVQVAETFTGFGDHLSSEALNASYYREEFDKLLHKLQDPVAVRPIPTPLLCVIQVLACACTLVPALPRCEGLY